jgi:hypothetical protein
MIYDGEEKFVMKENTVVDDSIGTTVFCRDINANCTTATTPSSYTLIIICLDSGF